MNENLSSISQGFCLFHSEESFKFKKSQLEKKKKREKNRSEQNGPSTISTKKNLFLVKKSCSETILSFLKIENLPFNLCLTCKTEVDHAPSINKKKMKIIRANFHPCILSFSREMAKFGLINNSHTRESPLIFLERQLDGLHFLLYSNIQTINGLCNFFFLIDSISFSSLIEFVT